MAGTALFFSASPVLAQQRPADVDAPFLDLDWSLGLRGSYENNSVAGNTYEAILAPEVTLTRNGERGQTTLVTGGAFGIDENKQLHIEDAHVNADTNFALDEVTNLGGALDLTLTQPSLVDNTTLPANTAVAPLEFTGTATGVGTHKFGQFDLTGTIVGTRFIEGPTTLDDSSTVTNTDQSYWEGSGELRLGYELTPLVSVFVDGEDGYQKFDAASPALGVFLDGHTYTLRSGLSYTQPGTLTAEASIGRAWLDYDDPAITDAPGWVYDASLAFTPNETLTLSSAFETALGPSSTVAGDTDVGYTLTGSAKYLVNPWLTLRGSAGANRTVTLAAGAVDWGYNAGVGLDLASSRHAIWSADYLFTHDVPATAAASDDHKFTLGVTLKR